MTVDEDRERLTSELDRLNKDLMASDAWRMHVSLRKLDQSFSAFEDSDKKLAAALIGAQHPSVIMEVFDEAHRERVDKLIIHFGNLLQNYVAAAFSLADTTRTFAKRTYSDTTFWPEYAARIQTDFADSGPPHFVRDLKNHSQHESAVLLTAGFNISDIQPSGECNTRTIVALNLARIREEVDLSAQAKAYVDSKGDQLDLVTLLDDYSPVVFDFHRWLRQRQAEIHAEQFTEIDRYQEEMQAVSAQLAELNCTQPG